MTEKAPRPDPALQLLGATIRQYRQERGLSHRALAARTGIRSSYISEIELGKRNISVLTLLRMTHVLRIPSAWLFEQVDTHAPLAPPAAYGSPSFRHVQDAGVTNDATPSLKPDDQARLLPLLGATIRQYRQQRGLFQAALATMTDLTPTYIGEIERGKRNLSVLSLTRIADALELPLAHLLASLETCQSSCPPLTR